MGERTDTDLLSWAVRIAPGHRPTARWSHVANMLGLGSTSAIKVCVRFGEDPDEIIGGCPDCIERAEVPT